MVYRKRPASWPPLRTLSLWAPERKDLVFPKGVKKMTAGCMPTSKKMAKPTPGSISTDVDDNDRNDRANTYLK